MKFNKNNLWWIIPISLIIISVIFLLIIPINTNKGLCEKSGGIYQEGSFDVFGSHSGSCICPDDKVEYLKRCIDPKDDPCIIEESGVRVCPLN